MDVIVQLRGTEGPRVKSDQVYIIVGRRYCGQDGCKSVVGGVSFDDEWSSGNPLGQDWSGGERLFEGVERCPTFFGEVPWSIFTG